MPDIALLSPPAEELYMDLIDLLKGTDDPGPVHNMVPDPRPAKFVRVELLNIFPVNRREFDCNAQIHYYNTDDAEGDDHARRSVARLVAYKQEWINGWWVAWAKQIGNFIRNDDPQVEGLARYQFMISMRFTGKAL